MNVLTLEWLSTMGVCMVVGRNGGAYTKEWSNKTREFIDYAFSLSNNGGMKCPCSKCRNSICVDKMALSLHICKVSFILGYEVWVHHGESVHQTVSVAEENDSTSDDRMDDMFDAIRPEFGTNPEDPPTTKFKFFSTSTIFFQVWIPWFNNRQADYFEFCQLWSSSVFKLVSEKKGLVMEKI
jgi:hypothetical protein